MKREYKRLDDFNISVLETTFQTKVLNKEGLEDQRKALVATHEEQLKVLDEALARFVK